MKNYLIVIINFIMLICFAGLPSCSSPAKNTNIFSIVATTGMIADAAKEIAGDSARIIALMGPGVDPHLYKPSQHAIEQLTEADLILYNGLHLEGKMQEVLEKVGKRRKVKAVADDIPASRLLLLESGQNAYDPHIWFDVSLWQEAVKNISQTMQDADTAHAQYYQQRTANYLTRLQVLHEEVISQLATIPDSQRVLVTAHDAFSYFGRAYNIEVRGLQGISTLSEYGVQDISRLAEFLANRKIKAVFIESSVSPKSLEAVVEGVRQRGHSIRIGGSLFSDAMGEAGTPEGSYEGMVRHNVETITQALK